ncbi:hypothetical protein GCM10023340_37010 [Nocardioides marinquilinus]|uniref:Peptidase metallopeptidase domain-containing protein n=1 Tax=Nocardioides marinquilinus TaxID=1210400 RepID=A0ABP9PZL7_9ACTN
MKHPRRTSICLAAVAVVAAGLGGGLTPAASGADDTSGGKSGVVKPGYDIPSFQEFKADTFRDKDGQWIVNGDEALGSLEELRAYYGRMVNHADGKGGPENGLIVNQDGFGDDVWSASQAQNLTYCVSNSFGSSKTTVVNAMAQGAALWENASSSVNFTYVSSADSNCTTSNNSVLFSVEPTSTNQYIARAFFPSSGDYERNVLVNPTALVSSGWAPSNILGHELGHTLGFRHEHTRPEAGGVCFEDNNWRPLTAYDSNSIMHYPQCNGTSDDLSFSADDATGVAEIYG